MEEYKYLSTRISKSIICCAEKRWPTGCYLVKVETIAEPETDPWLVSVENCEGREVGELPHLFSWGVVALIGSRDYQYVGEDDVNKFSTSYQI